VTGNLTLAAAFVLGLFASGHCVLMCGGISGALMLASVDPKTRRPPLRLLLALQAGRVTSYMLAAVLLAGAGAAIVQFVDAERVRIALRLLAAATFALIGLSLLGKARGLDVGFGQAVWRRLAPLSRRLLPARSIGQAFALGGIWGWMPCGFVYSVLLLAWLGMDPLRSAATMGLFGLGTMPALIAGNFGIAGLLRVFGQQRARASLAGALLVMATLTAAGPWLALHGAHWAQWLPFDCAP
jgi:sulfite exporter TauE/SafE